MHAPTGAGCSRCAPDDTVLGEHGGPIGRYCTRVQSWSALTKQVLNPVVSPDHRACNDEFTSRWRVQRFDDSRLKESLWSGRRWWFGGTRFAASVESRVSTHPTVRMRSGQRSTALRRETGRGAPRGVFLRPPACAAQVIGPTRLGRSSYRSWCASRDVSRTAPTLPPSSL